MGYSRTRVSIFHYIKDFFLTHSSIYRRFRSLIPSYIRDSSVAVVVYDITSKFLL
jgi:hypothetical protein